MSDFGIPLPELPSHLCNTPTIPDAYAKILSFERALYNLNRTNDQLKRLMYARIVGYLILEGPSEEACIAVAHEVVSCKNEEKLLDIGQHYYCHYICAFRQYKPHAPVLSIIKKGILAVEAPQNLEQVTDNALVRDGFHCILTGYYSFAVSESNSLELRMAAWAADTVSTGCAQIFPEAIIANISAGKNRSIMNYYVTGVWKVLDHFGYKMVLYNLKDAKIHHLENVFTVCCNAHVIFDRLELWFEPTGILNTYRICTADPSYIDPTWKTTVTFTTPDPEKLPVPSQDYFELHAGCCRVACLSGAGKYINRMVEEMEDVLLPSDGNVEEIQCDLFLN